MAMTPTIDVEEGKMEGRLLAGLGRLMSGESFFLQTLTAARGPGSVFFAPASPGEVVALDLQPGDGYVIQRTAFWRAAKRFRSAPRCRTSRGAVQSGRLSFSQNWVAGWCFWNPTARSMNSTSSQTSKKIVDNGHLVAWSQSMRYELEMDNPGFIAAFTSGEDRLSILRSRPAAGSNPAAPAVRPVDFRFPPG